MRRVATGDSTRRRGPCIYFDEINKNHDFDDGHDENDDGYDSGSEGDGKHDDGCGCGGDGGRVMTCGHKRQSVQYFTLLVTPSSRPP